MVDSSVLSVPDHSVSVTTENYCSSPALHLPSDIIQNKASHSSQTPYIHERCFHCVYPQYPVSTKRINHCEFFIELFIGFYSESHRTFSFSQFASLFFDVLSCTSENEDKMKKKTTTALI